VYNEKKDVNMLEKYDPDKQEEKINKKEKEYRQRLIRLIEGVTKIEKIKMKTVASYIQMEPNTINKLLSYNREKGEMR